MVRKLGLLFFTSLVLIALSSCDLGKSNDPTSGSGGGNTSGDNGGTGDSGPAEWTAVTTYSASLQGTWTNSDGDTAVFSGDTLTVFGEEMQAKEQKGNQYVEYWPDYGDYGLSEYTFISATEVSVKTSDDWVLSQTGARDLDLDPDFVQTWYKQ